MHVETLAYEVHSESESGGSYAMDEWFAGHEPDEDEDIVQYAGMSEISCTPQCRAAIDAHQRLPAPVHHRLQSASSGGGRAGCATCACRAVQ